MTARKSKPVEGPIPDFFELKQAVIKALEGLEPRSDRAKAKFEIAALRFDGMAERYAKFALAYHRELHKALQTDGEARAQLDKIQNGVKPLLEALRCLGGPALAALNATRSDFTPHSR